jgi:hypothetical protein
MDPILKSFDHEICTTHLGRLALFGLYNCSSIFNDSNTFSYVQKKHHLRLFIKCSLCIPKSLG